MNAEPFTGTCRCGQLRYACGHPADAEAEVVARYTFKDDAYESAFARQRAAAPGEFYFTEDDQATDTFVVVKVTTDAAR